MIAETTQKPTEPREPRVSDAYESNRGSEYLLLYIDEQIVLLRDTQTKQKGNNIHRMEARSTFDNMIERGHMEYKPDADLDLVNPAETDWSEVNLIGDKTSDRLNQEGYTNAIEIEKASDEKLQDSVDGLGPKAIANLRNYI